MKAACVIDSKELMRKSLERKLKIKISDIKVNAGIWYALVSGQESRNDGGWASVSELLQKPKFTVRSEGSSAFDGKPALYLID
jgi:hypothetical protein